MTRLVSSTKALQTSLASVEISVYDSTTTVEREGKNDIHLRVVVMEPLLTKINPSKSIPLLPKNILELL